MPRYGDFVALERDDHDQGFRVAGAVGVTKDGRVELRLDPTSPFYVNARGELSLRVGEGLIAEPGSPVRLVAQGSRATRLAVAALQTAQSAADADLTALSASVATNTSDIATLTATKASTDVATTLVAGLVLQTEPVADSAAGTPVDLPEAITAIGVLEAKINELLAAMRVSGQLET